MCRVAAKKPSGVDWWKFEQRVAVQKKGAKYTFDAVSRVGDNKYEMCAYSNWLLPNDVPYFSLTELSQLDQSVRGDAKLAFGQKCAQPHAEFDVIVKAKKSNAQCVLYL